MLDELSQFSTILKTDFDSNLLKNVVAIPDTWKVKITSLDSFCSPFPYVQPQIARQEVEFELDFTSISYGEILINNRAAILIPLLNQVDKNTIRYLDYLISNAIDVYGADLSIITLDTRISDYMKYSRYPTLKNNLLFPRSSVEAWNLLSEFRSIYTVASPMAFVMKIINPENQISLLNTIDSLLFGIDIKSIGYAIEMRKYFPLFFSSTIK